ncbi:hypothetical protein BH24DEI2_BH24DEI2_05970 [soil metagenome]
MNDPASGAADAAPKNSATSSAENSSNTSTSASTASAWAGILLPIALIFGLVLLLTLNVGESVPRQAESNPLEAWLKISVGYIATGAEIAAALVIGLAVARGIFGYVGSFFRAGSSASTTESIRLRLGRVLTLGLEFTVASDILRTAVAPNRQDILNLGAIVLLRTLLNYFLEQEIQQGERSHEVGKGV